MYICKETNSAVCDDFSSLYPLLSEHLLNQGNKQKSRNGDTIELLNFKTIICNPYQRCTGGYNRGTNIFFLLAEALWIWSGRKDVETLAIFNSQMKEYSDDKENFHAPYGWRLRKWTKPSDNIFHPEKVYAENDFDQIRMVLEMLSKNPNDRRAVASIWNPLFDLNIESKDLPCNDMVMFKIRDGLLYTTIQNRSNDLHWGLTTNVFQFSFIGELMSQILGVRLGEQVHNSQSLHCYLNNSIPLTLHYHFNKELKDVEGFQKDMYSFYRHNQNEEMYFNFEDESISDRLNIVDDQVNFVLDNFKEDNLQFVANKNTSQLLIYICELLNVYYKYTFTNRYDSDKMNAIESIKEIGAKHKYDYSDYHALAMSFFVSRLKDTNLLDNLDARYANL